MKAQGKKKKKKNPQMSTLLQLIRLPAEQKTSAPSGEMIGRQESCSTEQMCYIQPSHPVVTLYMGITLTDQVRVEAGFSFFSSFSEY